MVISADDLQKQRDNKEQPSKKRQADTSQNSMEVDLQASSSNTPHSGSTLTQAQTPVGRAQVQYKIGEAESMAQESWDYQRYKSRWAKKRSHNHKETRKA